MKQTKRTNAGVIKELSKEMESDIMLQLVVMTALKNYGEAIAITTEEQWNSMGGKMIVFKNWQEASAKLLKIINIE